MHQHEQADRAQRDRLAARVRTGDDQRPEVRAELHVDRHHPPAEAGVTGALEADLGSGGRLRADRVHLPGETCLGAPQVEPGKGVERLAEGLGLAADERRQLVEDPVDLHRLRELRLAPGVAQLHRHQRLHEQRLAAPRGVVDDPLDLAPGVGANGHHVAPVAQGHDGVLQGRAHLAGVDQLLQARAQALVGDPGRTAQAPEARRGRVQELAGRVEAALQGGAERGERMQAPGQVVEERPAVAGQDVPQAPGRFDRLGDGGELRGVEAAAAGGPLHRRPDVVGAADPRAGMLRQQGADLGGLLEADLDEDRVGQREQRLGQAAAGREPGRGGQPLADQRELQEGDRLGVHQPASPSPAPAIRATRRTATGRSAQPGPA